MKMSDVFELPVCVPVSTYDELADDFCRHIAEFAARRPAKAAAHAVNMHDELVDSHAWLLIHFKSLLRGSPVRNADEIISRAEKLIKRNRGEE